MSKEDEASSGPHVRIVLGTMTFGGQVDKEGTAAQLKAFADGNKKEARDKVELDTARMYCAGKTEELMGELFAEDEALRARYIMASKVNPFPGLGKSLTAESVAEQAAATYKALGQDCVDIMYLHAPDHVTPIEETLAAVDKLHKAGQFKELGLSNYAAWQCMDIWHLCDKNGWVKPTIIQGMYNGITRDVEREMFPALRKMGMRFYAYNPLGGGLLTGKHKSLDTGPAEDSGRFTGDAPWAVAYRNRYFKKEFFEGLDVLRAACDAAGIPMAEASLRWLAHHSFLKGEHGDGIIIGASSQRHLEANLAAAQGEPLPAAVVEAYDAAWAIAKPQCPSYFR